MHPPSSRDHSSHSNRVEDLYIEFLSRQDAGERIDFESWCAEHPLHAADLQQVREEDQRLTRMAGELGFASGSIVDRISTNPAGPSLESDADRQSDPSGESSTFFEHIANRPNNFSKYHLRRVIGRGSMGEVHRVWDEDLRRHLAMKVLSERLRATGPSQDPRVGRAQARFIEEAQVTSQLDHPGVVPVHDIGVSPEGQVYFTMKLVKGRELAEVFRMVHESQAGWTLTRALGLILKVTEAMAYAHSKGVLHRDLKPANIMVGRYGAVYVMDWGLARVIGDDGRSVLLADGHSTLSVGSDRRDKSAKNPDNPEATSDGDSVGTPAYMSPEQASGDNHRVQEWTDIYGLGAMLYHLISGRAPYTVPGKRITADTVLHGVRAGAPVDTRELAPTIPSELHAIVAKAMNRIPESRYKTMEALQGDILAFIEGRVVQAAAPIRGTGAWKWVLRNKWIAGAGLGTLALLVTSVMRGGDKALPSPDQGTPELREAMRTVLEARSALLSGRLDPKVQHELEQALAELQNTDSSVSAATVSRRIQAALAAR